MLFETPSGLVVMSRERLKELVRRDLAGYDLEPDRTDVGPPERPMRRTGDCARGGRLCATGIPTERVRI